MEAASSSCGSNEEMANICHGSTSATSQTGPLPSIESLLEVFRGDNENPPESSNEQTTWYQFRICSEKNSNRKYSMSTFHPNHPMSHHNDKSVFTLDSTPQQSSQEELSEVEVGGEGLRCHVEGLRSNRSDTALDGRKIYLFNNHICNFSEQKLAFLSETKKSDIDEAEDNSSDVLPAEDRCSSQSGSGNSLKATHLAEDGERDDSEDDLLSESKAIVSANRETTESENLKDPVILEPEKTREESIRELFNNLGQLLPCGDIPNLSRYKILDSSVQCIQSLLWRRQGMKRDSLENVSNLNEFKTQEAKDSCETTLDETKGRRLKMVQVKDKNKPKQANRKYKNESKPKAKSKKVSVVETKVDSLSKINETSRKVGTFVNENNSVVGISFVNENNSVSQVADSNKSIALFFEDKQKNVLKSSKKAQGSKKGEGNKTRSLRNGKLSKTETNKLERKAFMMYARVWRSRVKNEMPGCTRAQITSLLKCRWQGLSRKTKKRYQKKWEEESQETTLVIEKSKKNEGMEGTTQSKKNQTKGALKRKKEPNKIEKYREENNERALKKTKKDKTTKDETVNVNIVNWVQCDKCKNWRIIPENVDISTLPNRWYCGMNKDKKHNKCIIPEENYPAAQV